MRADTDAHPEPRAWYLITLRAAGENVETMNLSLWQLHTSYIVGRASSEPPLSWTRGQSISEAMASPILTSTASAAKGAAMAAAATKRRVRIGGGADRRGQGHFSGAPTAAGHAVTRPAHTRCDCPRGESTAARFRPHEHFSPSECLQVEGG